MEAVHDTIIIGSGIGGLACASALAKCGHKVLVFEQHAGMFKSTLLARGIHVEQHIRGGKNGSQSVHTAICPFRTFNAQSIAWLTVRKRIDTRRMIMGASPRRS